LPIVRIACERCGRAGSYRLDGLIERFGADAARSAAGAGRVRATGGFQPALRDAVHGSRGAIGSAPRRRRGGASGSERLRDAHWLSSRSTARQPPPHLPYWGPSGRLAAVAFNRSSPCVEPRRSIINVSRAHALAAYPHTRRRIGTTSPDAIGRRVVHAWRRGASRGKGRRSAARTYS